MICWRADGHTEDPLGVVAEGLGMAGLENTHEVGMGY